MAIEYEIFQHEPDTSETPTARWMQASDVLNIATAPEFIAWPDSDPQQALTFRYTFDTRNPLLSAKDFFSRHGGSAVPFLLPSWERQITPAEIPTTGAVQVEVVGTDWLANYPVHHPDGPGRYAFVFDPVGGFHGFRITDAEPFTPSTSMLTIEQPLPFTPTEEAIWGWLYAVRFASDEAEWEHYHPQRATIQFSFITTRQRFTKDETAYTEALEIYASLPLSQIIAEQGLPPAFRYDVAYATGPQNLRLNQSANFTQRWAAWFSTAGVRLGRFDDGEITPPDDTEGSPCDMFTGPVDSKHISLAFDQNGWECIAWQHDTTTAKLRKYTNGILTTYTWAGICPVMFYNGNIAIQDRLDGESDVFAYYMKPGQAILFARVQRNAFAIEYKAALLPLLPIYLISADHDLDAKIYNVTFIDSGWRVCRAVCEPYPDPPEIPPDPYVQLFLDDAAEFSASVVPLNDGYGSQYQDGIVNAFQGNEGQEAAAVGATLPLSDVEPYDPLSKYESAGSLPPPELTDPMGLGIAVLSTSKYELGIMEALPPGEAAAVGVAILTASYTLAIADGGLVEEAAPLSISILPSSFYGP